MVTERRKKKKTNWWGFFLSLWGTKENQQENSLKSSWQDYLESASVRAASDLS